MKFWPAGLEAPVSLLVENVRTDAPDYMDDIFPEWDEPAEKLSKVTLTMPNGAQLILVQDDPADCIGPDFIFKGYWDDYLKHDEGDVKYAALHEVVLTALENARAEALAPHLPLLSGK
jgi:hypothetical protein